MGEMKWIWWNLRNGPTAKDDLIRELRRALEAAQEREMDLRQGEWFLKCLTTETLLMRWQYTAQQFYENRFINDPDMERYAARLYEALRDGK